MRHLPLCMLAILLFQASSASALSQPPAPSLQEKPAVESTSSNTTHAEPESHSDLELSGGLSSPYVSNGGRVTFWVRAINRSSHNVTALMLGPLEPMSSYSLDTCWAVDPSSEKSLTMTDSSCPSSSVTLAPGQEITLGGEIRAFGLADQQTMGILAKWTSVSSSQSKSSSVSTLSHTSAPPFLYTLVIVPTSSHVVILGPLSSDSPFTYFLETHAVLVSIFGIALLAVAAYLLRFPFEWFRQRQEATRARKAETWTQLLQDASKFSLKYYLPAEAALANFLTNARSHRAMSQGPADAAESQEKPGLTARLAFFYWATFERRMYEIMRRIGGLHFKDYTGEEIVGLAYFRYKLLFYYRSQKERNILDGLLDKTPLLTTSAKFLRLLDGHDGIHPDPHVVDAWDMFHHWLHKEDADRAMRLLEASDPVFQFEVNRPYYYWYGHMDPPNLDAGQLSDLRSLYEEAPSGSPAGVVAQAHTEARRWHKRLKKYVKGTKKAG